jgi:hypothetical protein
MENSIQFIRKLFYDTLNGNVSLSGSTLPIYNRVPSTATYPYIFIYSEEESSSNFNKSKFISTVITKIEVVIRYSGNAGGELQIQNIVSDIQELIKPLISTQLDLSGRDRNVITNKINNVTYLRTDLKDHYYQRAIIETENDVELLV